MPEWQRVMCVRRVRAALGAGHFLFAANGHCARAEVRSKWPEHGVQGAAMRRVFASSHAVAIIIIIRSSPSYHIPVRAV